MQIVAWQYPILELKILKQIIKNGRSNHWCAAS